MPRICCCVDVVVAAKARENGDKTPARRRDDGPTKRAREESARADSVSVRNMDAITTSAYRGCAVVDSNQRSSFCLSCHGVKVAEL